MYIASFKLGDLYRRIRPQYLERDSSAAKALGVAELTGLQKRGRYQAGFVCQYDEGEVFSRQNLWSCGLPVSFPAKLRWSSQVFFVSLKRWSNCEREMGLSSHRLRSSFTLHHSNGAAIWPLLSAVTRSD